MSDKGSVFQKGGGGTNFEQSIQAAFITTLLISGNVPCIPASHLIEVALQTTNRGFETDDLLAVAKSARGQHQLLIQVKHNISFSKDNETFKEVIKGFWKDYNNTSVFNKELDQLLVIKSGMTGDERNHVRSLFNWAKTHATETDFITEVNRIEAKKKRLEVFREVLEEANDNNPLADKELWGFLRCMDVVEYDFLNEASIDETYFLNLIRICRKKNSTLNEKEIWDCIFAFASKLNKDGGSITIDSIKNEDFFGQFDTAQLSPYFKAVEKLRSDSKEILRPIKLTIGKSDNELHLLKPSIREKLIESIGSRQFTIVTGKPGVGKSAKIKELLETDLASASVFVFRADQFNEPAISKVFSSQGVTESIQDLFSCISLIPDKIIFIDSLEKLLEADPECAFKQLLALLKDYPDIKVVCSSRKYAIDLIILKFGLDKEDYGIVELATLDDDEIGLVSNKFPQLAAMLKNSRIKKLLESPKYLDFAISALTKTTEDYSNISLVEFKNKLWNSLVVDAGNTRNGLPIKREVAFMEIAVKRAKEMKLFTKPVNSDAEAIVLLENDEIVFQENQNRKYSPSHDILEDWALVKYVSDKFEDYPNPTQFFSNLGNEPAIRRAFRLWVEDCLEIEDTRVNDLVDASINSDTIERYWADEILVAILKSDNSSHFFQNYEADLLRNEATLLNRCIHLLRTCCKESNFAIKDFLFLTPIGSGWTSLLLFVKNHLQQLEKVKPSICTFLYDWKNRIGQKDSPPNNIELLAAKNIIISYFNEVERGDEYWQEDFHEKQSINLIQVLYDLAAISKSEIESLVDRAFEYKKDRNSWMLNSFYESVIENCLTGIGNWKLIKEMPGLVVKTAWESWKYVPRKKGSESEEGFSFYHDNRLRDEECWGIRDKHSFFPPSIYKTPFYNLLFFHPGIGLDFIIDFINYSVEFYVNADCEYKHKISQVEVELNDGTIIKQWAAWELWAAYRGSSVTTYALESLLRSLEKYLLEIAAVGTDISKENLKYIFNMLLMRSNNVAITSVLNSVAIAYPEIVEESMLPILGVPEFYDWDLTRAVHEHQSMAMIDNDIPFSQEETIKSNQLPHRKKYRRGMTDFIIDYQFYIGTLNPQLHTVFDKLEIKIKNNDIYGKKRLSEIDIRKWEVKPYEEGRMIIQPKYQEEVATFLNTTKEKDDYQSISLAHSEVISKAYERKEPISFEKWVEIHESYSQGFKTDLVFNRPITLAIIALRDFPESMSQVQFDWCITTLDQAIVAILKDTYSRNYESNSSFNLLEKEIALSAFHLLMQYSENDDRKDEIISIEIYMLAAPFSHHEIGKVLTYFREIFSKHFPSEAKRIWLGLISFSKFKKKNSYFYDDYDPERLGKAKIAEGKFIEVLGHNHFLQLNLSEISLEQCEGYMLARAFCITPFDCGDRDFEQLIRHFIPIITADLETEDDYSYSRQRKGRQLHLQSINEAEFYLRDLLMRSSSNFANEVLDLILAPIYQPSFVRNRNGRDVFEFALSIPKHIIYELDQLIANSNDDDFKKQLLVKFWSLWEHYFNRIKNSGKQYFLSNLFLNIEWKDTATHWAPLEGKKTFYQSMVRDLGKYDTTSIVNVFSTIGERTFLPESISLLVEIFKSDANTTTCLFSPSAKRLIQRLFYNHISKIKASKTLIDDYVWILNKMVDFGSSEAYMFRENVITYKATG